MLDRLRCLPLAAVAAYARRFPRGPGRWRMLQAALPRLRVCGHRLGLRQVRLARYDLRFECNLADWLGQYVWLTGTYEPATEQVMRACISPGDLALDVGANVGFFSVVMARLAGPGGAVHAFEPVPALGAAVRRQVGLNPGLAVVLHDWAASDEACTAALSVGPADHAGLSSLRRLPEASATLSVQCRPIDAIAAELPPVRFVKIDVEGAEMKALRGMAQLLQRDQPILLVEVTDGFLAAFGGSAAGMTAWLRERGYELYRVVAEAPCQLLPLGVGEQPPQFNLLALPPARSAAVLAAVAASR